MDLQVLTNRLEDAYLAHERRLRGMGYETPLEVVDPNGRPILLDALSALVQAKAAQNVSEALERVAIVAHPSCKPEGEL